MKKETKTKQIIAEVIREERQKHFKATVFILLYCLIAIIVTVNLLWGVVLINMPNPEEVVTGMILIVNCVLLLVLVTEEKM